MTISKKKKILHIKNDCSNNILMDLIIEEPLNVYIQGEHYSVIMRTPGDENELIAGLCFVEGFVDSLSDFKDLNFYDEKTNIANVWLSKKRYEYVTSLLKSKSDVKQSNPNIISDQISDLKQSNSNMISEQISDLKQSNTNIISEQISDLKQSNTNIISEQIGAVNQPSDIISEQTIYDYKIKSKNGNNCKIKLDVLIALVNQLEKYQNIRKITKASHAAAIYDIKLELIDIKEDVKRHNAFDKVIGSVFMSEKINKAYLTILSSRVSYDLVQKACRAGISFILSISRPTSLAVEFAKKYNITLACLSKDKGLYLF